MFHYKHLNTVYELVKVDKVQVIEMVKNIHNNKSIQQHESIINLLDWISMKRFVTWFWFYL